MDPTNRPSYTARRKKSLQNFFTAENESDLNHNDDHEVEHSKAADGTEKIKQNTVPTETLTEAIDTEHTDDMSSTMPNSSIGAVAVYPTFYIGNNDDNRDVESLETGGAIASTAPTHEITVDNPEILVEAELVEAEPAKTADEEIIYVASVVNSSWSMKCAILLLLFFFGSVAIAAVVFAVTQNNDYTKGISDATITGAPSPPFNTPTPSFLPSQPPTSTASFSPSDTHTPSFLLPTQPPTTTAYDFEKEFFIELGGNSWYESAFLSQDHCSDLYDVCPDLCDDYYYSIACVASYLYISCDRDSNIISLSLSPVNLSFTAEIPSVLAKLTALRSLAIANDFTGAIPSELGSMTQLTHLEILSNYISGTIPSELGSLTQLTHLNIWGGNITGTIPSELGRMTKLEKLWLYENDLTGKIPSELGGMTDLVSLSSGYNELTGAIPSELGRMTKLTSLKLNDNELTGKFPSELGRMTDLLIVALRENDFNGSIPIELCTMSNKTFLFHDSNNNWDCG